MNKHRDKEMAQALGNKLRKAKAQNEQNEGHKVIKKRLYKYVKKQEENRKKKKHSPLLMRERGQITDDTKKSEEFNSPFVSVFTKKVKCDHTLNRMNVKGQEHRPKIGKELVKEYVGKIDMFKLAGPDIIHCTCTVLQEQGEGTF